MKILDLPAGWSLHHEYDDPEIGPLPMLIHKRWGRWPDVRRIAYRDEGVEVFTVVKTWLDDADHRMARNAQSVGAWKAIDKAKMAIEDGLRQAGKWDDRLLDTKAELEYREREA